MDRGALHVSQHASRHASTSFRFCPDPTARLSAPGRHGRCARPARAPPRPAAALPPIDPADALTSASSTLSHLLALAYEPLVLPCSRYNCGDMVYRSSLDPVLRHEDHGISPQGIALLASALAYLFTTPGVLPGVWDMYVAAPLQRLRSPTYSKDDFVVGKKLGGGGFGAVYRGELLPPGGIGPSTPVILKRATEFGEAETWMNERMTRAAPKTVARFLGAFPDGPTAKAGDPLWLAWEFEGEFTLGNYMVKKDFPYCLENILFGEPLDDLPRGPERRATAIRTAMEQLLRCVKACHETGIVHRDVKPENVVVSEVDRRLKVIDLGAAADLRVGINYVPNEFLLDPRYAPPQQFIMSAQTPRAPPTLVATFLSPILWQLNGPDRFDMWSCGLVLLQMALPPLRSDSGLAAFNKAFELFQWDLQAWRNAQESRGGKERKEWAEGFAVLDAFDGAGWDLAVDLLRNDPEDRPSCARALAHPFFGKGPLTPVATAAGKLGRAAVDGLSSMDDGWLGDRVARAGTAEAGGFTETSLRDALGEEGGPSEEQSWRRQSATVAWWQSRQAAAAGAGGRSGRDRRGLLDLGEDLQRKARKTIKSTLNRQKRGSGGSRPAAKGPQAAKSSAGDKVKALFGALTGGNRQ